VSTRDGRGIPGLAKDARPAAPARKTCTGTEARLAFRGLDAALKRRSSTVLRVSVALPLVLSGLGSISAWAWGMPVAFPVVALPKRQRDGDVESHVSQKTRDMGHAL